MQLLPLDSQSILLALVIVSSMSDNNNNKYEYILPLLAYRLSPQGTSWVFVTFVHVQNPWVELLTSPTTCNENDKGWNMHNVGSYKFNVLQFTLCKTTTRPDICRTLFFFGNNSHFSLDSFLGVLTLDWWWWLWLCWLRKMSIPPGLMQQHNSFLFYMSVIGTDWECRQLVNRSINFLQKLFSKPIFVVSWILLEF